MTLHFLKNSSVKLSTTSSLVSSPPDFMAETTSECCLPSMHCPFTWQERNMFWAQTKKYIFRQAPNNIETLEMLTCTPQQSEAPHSNSKYRTIRYHKAYDLSPTKAIEIIIPETFASHRIFKTVICLTVWITYSKGLSFLWWHKRPSNNFPQSGTPQMYQAIILTILNQHVLMI